MNLGELIQLISSVGKAGTGIYSAFSDKQELPAGYEQALSAQNAAQTYLGASTDPNSIYFQNIAGAEEQRSRNDLISSIGEIIRQNASRNATGRGTINPERRDETIWGMLAKGFQEAGLRARETARQRLVDLAGGSSKIASGFAPFAQVGLVNNQLNRNSRFAGLGGSFDLASRLGEGIAKPGTLEHGKSSTPNFWENLFKPGAS